MNQSTRISCPGVSWSKLVVSRFAGRSVWREVVSRTGAHREEFLTTVALPRLERLIEAAEHRARPWTEATRP